MIEDGGSIICLDRSVYFVVERFSCSLHGLWSMILLLKVLFVSLLSLWSSFVIDFLAMVASFFLVDRQDVFWFLAYSYCLS